MLPLALFYLILTLGLFVCVYNWRRFGHASSIFVATLLIMIGLSRMMNMTGQPEGFSSAVEIAGVCAGLIAAIHGFRLSRTARRDHR